MDAAVAVPSTCPSWALSCSLSPLWDDCCMLILDNDENSCLTLEVSGSLYSLTLTFDEHMQVELPIGPNRIWAILMGIHGYSSYPLRRCVTDTLAMGDYLTKDLDIPKERIQYLLAPTSKSDTHTDFGSVLSHANIISMLLSLAVNPYIEHEDPIIIFFTGHGTRYLWLDSDADFDEEHDDDPQNFVKALCPVDPPLCVQKVYVLQ